MSAGPHDTSPFAFPVGYSPEGNSADQQGMSLRDYFAGQALAGMMGKYGDSHPTAIIAGYAYEMADAMLAARAKR